MSGLQILALLLSPEGPEAPALLQGLREHLVLADVIVADGAARESHGLLKVILPDLRDWVRVLFLQRDTHSHHGPTSSRLPNTTAHVSNPP